MQGSVLEISEPQSSSEDEAVTECEVRGRCKIVIKIRTYLEE